jgi:3-oxoacyl-[acyl-carrier protein] reductase
MIPAKKVSILIGGTGEIGSAIAIRLFDLGCAVVLVSRGISPRNPILRQAVTDPARLTFHQADFADEKQVKTCLNDVKSVHGHIDFVVYSAGIAPDPDTPLSRYLLSDWLATLNTYLTGFFLCFRESMEFLESGAHILAVSSAVTRLDPSSVPGLHVGHYAAAKHALDTLVKWARHEAHGRGLLLSRIAPGAVDTPFHRNAPARRKPTHVLPLAVVAERIVGALVGGIEIDEELVAQ